MTHLQSCKGGPQECLSWSCRDPCQCWPNFVAKSDTLPSRHSGDSLEEEPELGGFVSSLCRSYATARAVLVAERRRDCCAGETRFQEAKSVQHLRSPSLKGVHKSRQGQAGCWTMSGSNAGQCWAINIKGDIYSYYCWRSGKPRRLASLAIW